MPVPIRLIELWLTLVHGALCRQVAGGLLVRLPCQPQLLVGEGAESVRETLVLVDGSDRVQLEQEASRVLSQGYAACTVADDIKEISSTDSGPHLSLRRILSDLQGYLLEITDPIPEDAKLLAFFLRHGEYRSRHISVRRAIYHVVPHENGWKVKRQGEDEGDTYALKEEAIGAGADRARRHIASQLIIHAANGTFEEERTYGKDPSGSKG